MSLDSILLCLGMWADQRGYVDRVWVFGSRVRGDHREDSDLDILIDYNTDHVGGPNDPPNDHDELEVEVGCTLHLPESTTLVPYESIRSAPVVRKLGKVLCVMTPRVPRSPNV